jgi:hypothetical protein
VKRHTKASSAGSTSGQTSHLGSVRRAVATRGVFWRRRREWCTFALLHPLRGRSARRRSGRARHRAERDGLTPHSPESPLLRQRRHLCHLLHQPSQRSSAQPGKSHALCPGRPGRRVQQPQGSPRLHRPRPRSGRRCLSPHRLCGFRGTPRPSCRQHRFPFALGGQHLLPPGRRRTKLFGFNSSGALLGGSFPISLPAGAVATPDIAVDPSSNVYVSDCEHKVIKKYSSSGTSLGTISTSAQGGPNKIAFDSNGDLFFSPCAVGIPDSERRERERLAEGSWTRRDTP